MDGPVVIIQFKVSWNVHFWTFLCDRVRTNQKPKKIRKYNFSMQVLKSLSFHDHFVLIYLQFFVVVST